MLAKSELPKEVPHQTFQFFCYSAVVPEGTVEISLPKTGSTELDAVDSTLKLAKFEPVIAAIEDWLGLGLEFDTNITEYVAPPLFSVGDSEVPDADISIPATLWTRKHAEVEQFLSKPFVRAWSSYHGRFELDRIVLTAADQARLRPGAVILLPTSFKPDWSVELCMPALKYRQSGILTQSPLRWRGIGEFLDDSFSSIDPATVQVHDQVSCYFQLSAEVLLRSVTAMERILSNHIADSSCVINTVDGQLYSGHLVSVGTGFGLQLKNAL